MTYLIFCMFVEFLFRILFSCNEQVCMVLYVIVNDGILNIYWKFTKSKNQIDIEL